MNPLRFLTFPTHTRSWLPVLFGLILLLLSACSTRRPPLQITEATVSPEPRIGQVATLHIEFMSPYDEPLTTLEIFLPEGVKLVKGDLTWKGSLTANQPQTHDISICTEYQGNYKIGITGQLWIAEDHAGFLEPRKVILVVSQTDAQVVTDENYPDFLRVQPTSTFGPAILPTALPGDWVSPCP